LTDLSVFLGNKTTKQNPTNQKNSVKIVSIISNSFAMTNLMHTPLFSFLFSLAVTIKTDILAEN